MPSIGPLEIVMVLVVALLVFGPRQLPELSRKAGRGLRQVQQFQQGFRGQLEHALDPDDDRE